jgi:ABC-type antimicrobial peptide transport system permease subunit
MSVQKFVHLRDSLRSIPSALLSIVSLVAAYVPAMRATRVSPIEALRA